MDQWKIISQKSVFKADLFEIKEAKIQWVKDRAVQEDLEAF